METEKTNAPEMPAPEMPIEQELQCFGYYGFGSGYEIAKLTISGQTAKLYQHASLYCGRCPEAPGCWEAHQKRVTALHPELMDELDRMFQEDDVTIEDVHVKFWTLHQVPPPDLDLNASNIEDGMAVGFGHQPKDRGLDSLPWSLQAPSVSPDGHDGAFYQELLHS